MPTAAAAERSKRKRASGVDKPEKRRRSSNDESGDVREEILRLESGILESKKNYNDVAGLLKKAGTFQDGNEESALAAAALCRIFVQLLKQGSLTLKKGLSEKETTVVRWLKDQLSHYKTTLLSFTQVDGLTVSGLTMAMRLLQAEGSNLQDKANYVFPKAFYEQIVLAVLSSEDEDGLKALIQDYGEMFDDIRFYTFGAVKSILEGSSGEIDPASQFDRAFQLLSAFDGVPESSDQLEDFYIERPVKKNHSLRSVTQHKRQGQEAWLALLSHAKTKEQRKRVLDIISTVIAPWFTKPELLADYLTQSYNAGGSLSLLALSGVFYLIQERNLDYPSFYAKLYSLLDRDILHSKHRSRFFRLLDTFLASTHLPAALVASFIKRLSRLALNAPPSAVVLVIPWVYNLFKLHPTCTFMVHRDSEKSLKPGNSEYNMDDPFLPDETDPMETKAIDSCLWELVQLQSHYHPNVATIANILSEQFTKQSYNIEDFLDHSYASLLDAEMSKNVRKAPVVEFQIPKRIFMPQDDPLITPDSLLVKLWDFGGSTVKAS